MVNVSEQFHNAVMENDPSERILMYFPKELTLFTNEDIHASGLKIMETANAETELTIGACLSASMQATILNYSGLLSGFNFGECFVSLGIKTADSTWTTGAANVTVYVGDTEICGYTSTPYLTINGTAPLNQPEFPVCSILATENTIYCISADGDIWVLSYKSNKVWGDLERAIWNDAADFTWDSIVDSCIHLELFSFNSFMTAKAKSWAKARRGISFANNILNEYYPDGKLETYEYVSLGVFNILKPSQTKVNLISVSAYDNMQLFNIDAASFLAGLKYPITLGEIYDELCDYVGVNTFTSTFINSSRQFTTPPMTKEEVSARDILGWIAEAACSFARISRDGNLELAWFANSNISLDSGDYFSAVIAEYAVAQIDKLQIASAESDIGVIIGEGTNGYQIMSNPYLAGSSDAEVRGYGTPIYNRLASFESFNPITLNAVCDWSIQAGDIITVQYKDVTYALPIYVMTLTWNGAAKAVYESTGSELRPQVMTATNRLIYQQQHATYQASLTIDGLSLALANNKLTFDEDGLHIYNGGFNIFDINNQKVFDVDTDGNLTLIGSLNSKNNDTGNEIAVNNGIIRFTNGSSVTGLIWATQNILYVSSPNQVWVDSSDLLLLEGTQIQLNSTNITMGSVPTTSSGYTARLVSDSGGYRLYRDSSSKRYKENIEYLTPDYGIDICRQLKPASFTLKDNQYGTFIGMIAEDVAEVCKEVVIYDKGRPDALQYPNMVALAISAIQNLDERLKKLEENDDK